MYIPAESNLSSSCEHINTLGEVEGFKIHYSVIITSLLVTSILIFIVVVYQLILSDFVLETSMLIFIVVVYQLILSDFVLDFNLSVCNIHYRESVKFTYERDDGLVRSWINHDYYLFTGNFHPC